jgi:spermidine synthase
MSDKDPWTTEYLEEKFANPDPWRYSTSSYERLKYKRQIDVINDRSHDPQMILEIGSAEGAHTLMLARQYPYARITSIEITRRAINRATQNLHRFRDRVELINADIADYAPALEDNAYDVCVWSESVYYIGAQQPMNKAYDLLKIAIRKLKPRGLLVMANTVDLPGDIPESVLTKRPLIDCYYNLLSSIAASALRAIYFEEKFRRLYEYQIWAFKR